MNIRILSDDTINKIAAGEVIERPASVVKELVENSIDSGAHKINIILECAGKNLIIVKDDGCGMDKDELELAIQRHATSKLDEDDLLNINSFGFRGEALPSIGAISKFTIASRKRGANHAYSLSVIGGIKTPTTESNLSEGTRIEVRDLFFATPARLKFLRSDKTELGATILMIKKIAIAHPEIAFSLSHDGKELIKVKASNHEDRIKHILGEEFTQNAALVDFEHGGVNMSGFVSIPTYNRATSEDQFLFINNRAVKDKILNISLKVAYQDYLERNRHAICALFLRLDPHFVDVNVHPTKSEVRFHDPNLIKQLVIGAVHNALHNSSDKVSTKTAQDMINHIKPVVMPQKPAYLDERTTIDNFTMPSFGVGAGSTSKLLAYQAPSYSYKEKTLQETSNTKLNQFIIDEIDSSNFVTSSVGAEHKPQLFSSILHMKSEEENNLNEEYRLGAAKTQLYNTYIVSQTKDSIIITDQHAAHERIGYEKIKAQISANGLIKQRLLIPEIVEMPDSVRADLLLENRDILNQLGFNCEKFGEKSIIIHEVPSIIGNIDPQKLARDIGDHLSEMGENIALTELIEHITETYACHYAIRAGRKLNIVEMNELLRQMENTAFSGQCNHGRQTYIELKLKDIEKLFGRR
jgi:DNA mismatch repair protein MutL